MSESPDFEDVKVGLIGCGSFWGIILLIVAIVNYPSVFLIAGALGGIVYLVHLYDKKRQEIQRIREEVEAQRKLKEQQRRQEELQKQQAYEEDRKYDRIINCPGCEGHGEAYLHAVFWKEQRELSVKFTEKEYLDKDGNYHGPTWKEYMATDYFSRATCPDCNGEGIAYAWFEKIAPQSVRCPDCQGTGKLTKRVKVEIGTEERQINCRKCNGEGKNLIEGKEVAHVKTISSSKTVSHHMTGGFFENKEYIQKRPRYFDVEITRDNKNFYSKSKPRSIPAPETSGAFSRSHAQEPSNEKTSELSSSLLYLRIGIISIVVLLFAWGLISQSDNLWNSDGLTRAERQAKTFMNSVKVRKLRFFKSGADIPHYKDRSYKTSFPENQSRYVCYELYFEFPRAKRRINFDITAIWYDSEGKEFARQINHAFVKSGWSRSYHAQGWGAESRENLEPGYYTVELILGGESVTGIFYILEQVR